MTVPRTVLREHIKERIIERIIDGTYPPGARIVELQIAQELGVSQAPVREALRDLAAMRFIETVPHRGARVRHVTVEELGEIYPVRAALEEVGGRAAAPRMTDDLLRELSAELESMHEAAKAGDVYRQLSHDARFHELIIQAAGNKTLVDVWRSLRVEARALVSVIKSDSDLPTIAEKHRSILDALRARNAELAAKEMREHIEHFGAIVARSD